MVRGLGTGTFLLALNTPCIEHTGSFYPNGYGRIWEDGKHHLAHRHAYEQEHGPIPDGMKVCHECDNRPCINIEHLFLGTQAENLEDMRSKGRGAKGETHGRSMLSLEQVTAIKERLRSGKRGIVTALARKYGVSQPTISLIKNEKTWQ